MHQLAHRASLSLGDTRPSPSLKRKGERLPAISSTFRCTNGSTNGKDDHKMTESSICYSLPHLLNKRPQIYSYSHMHGMMHNLLLII